MNTIIAPAYSVTTTSGTGPVRSAELLAAYEMPFVAPGTRLEFDVAEQTRELEVPIPRLAGMDDIELDRISLDISSDVRSEDVSVAGTPSNGEVAISLSGPSAAAARLERIEIEDLRITSTSTDFLVVQGTSGGLSTVLYGWDSENSTIAVIPDGNDPLAKHVHVLLRPAAGNSFGPPAAAAPHFAMPGAGAGLYGPALGGAWVRLTEEPGGIKAVLYLNPKLAGARFALLLGHAGQPTADAGLPNEVSPVGWSAANVKAIFDVRPSSIEVRASVEAAGPEQPVVAEFPSDPGERPVNVDFAGVARSLLKKAYPASTGTDLGLKLLFTSGSSGAIRVNLRAAAARYLIRPLEQGPSSLKLLGAPESIDLVVSDAFKPAAVSFTVDGIYGPARLTLDSDTGVPDTSHGLRVSGSVFVARQVALTAAETNLPIVRFGLFGRASEDSELLLSLHKGDEFRIGAPTGEPLSLEVTPASAPAWHRKEYTAPGLLPPHPRVLWLVVRATRGAFWWHGAMDSDGYTQRSAADGATYTQVGGRPGLHVSLREVDPGSGNPSPVHPVPLLWTGGLLNADIVGVAGIEASLPPDFRRFWIAEGTAHQSFLHAVPGLAGKLKLTFHCLRDVDLSVSEAVLTYNPWNA
jgi:hypothetical protein